MNSIVLVEPGKFSIGNVAEPAPPRKEEAQVHVWAKDVGSHSQPDAKGLGLKSMTQENKAGIFYLEQVCCGDTYQYRL